MCTTGWKTAIQQICKLTARECIGLNGVAASSGHLAVSHCFSNDKFRFSSAFTLNEQELAFARASELVHFIGAAVADVVTFRIRVQCIIAIESKPKSNAHVF